MKYTYGLISILAVASIAGLVFFANDFISEGKVDNGFQSAAYLPPEQVETEAQKNLRELREILDKFQSVKSFRSVIAVEQDGVSIKGEISVVKPNRFSGKMTVDSETVEVIGVDEVLYIKSPDEIWIPVRSEELTTQLKEAFSQAIQEGEVGSQLLPNDAVVTKQKDSNLSCDQYVTEIFDTEGNGTTLIVCAKDGYPVHIEATRGNGIVRADYSDYNVLFTIERPSIPKLFWPDIDNK